VSFCWQAFEMRGKDDICSGNFKFGGLCVVFVLVNITRSGVCFTKNAGVCVCLCVPVG
jgi:hypothetical protein